MKTQLWLVEAILKNIKETNNQVLKTTPKFIIDNFSKDIFSKSENQLNHFGRGESG